MCVEAIVCNVSVIFWDTVYIALGLCTETSMASICRCFSSRISTSDDCSRHVTHFASTSPGSSHSRYQNALACRHVSRIRAEARREWINFSILSDRRQQGGPPWQTDPRQSIFHWSKWHRPQTPVTEEYLYRKRDDWVQLFCFRHR